MKTHINKTKQNKNKGYSRSAYNCAVSAVSNFGLINSKFGGIPLSKQTKKTYNKTNKRE